MAAKLKRWQTRIVISNETDVNPEVGEDNLSTDEIVFVYSETIDQLRQAARTYLLSKRPVCFSNIGDHIIGCLEYYYHEAMPGRPKEEEGWWCYNIGLVNNRRKNYFKNPPTKMRSFEEVVDHFVQVALIPEKGPSYQSRAIIGHDIQLPLLERILREAEEYPINDLIQRGWHIIALEYKGELSLTGELTSRMAVFVMGHPEVQAATLTLDSDYYIAKSKMTTEAKKH